MGQTPRNCVFYCLVHSVPAYVNGSDTSFHDIRFAHRARDHVYSVVIVLLPSAQGTRSTLTPQVGQCTRRMRYTK